jgi:hypothetical protein
MIRKIKRLAKKWIEQYPFLYPLVRWYFELKIDHLPLQNSNDPVLVYGHDLSGITPLVQNNTREYCATLPDSIVMQPGKYRFGGGIYHCLTPAVYRFISPQYINQQHVVLDSKDPVLSALLLSFLSVRGNRDDRRLIKDLEQTAVSRFLLLTCGRNSQLCQTILQKNGITSRVVYTHTHDEVNSYNNGHVLLEVYSPRQQKYVLVDLDKKCSFFLNKKPLSLFEYSQALYDKDFVDIEFHSPVSMVDLSVFVERPTDFHYGFIEYNVYSSGTALREYLSRICQVPMMIDDDTTYACAWDDDVAAKLRKINSNWKIVGASEFQQRFYRQ